MNRARAVVPAAPCKKGHQMSQSHHKRSKTTARKPSPGPDIIRGLKGLKDALQNGVPLEERFTMRTVSLKLEPREFNAEEVVALREQFKASQGVFAKLLGISIKTLQAWEQGSNPPTPMARRLLETIQNNPKPWEQMLREAASVS